MMKSEYDEAAERFFNDLGPAGIHEIDRNLRDVVRGGDAELIAYWKGVQAAFRKRKPLR